MPDAHVIVDALRWEDPIRRIWATFGFDELNWSATPQGKRNLQVIHDLAETPYYVRGHNLFTSGSATGIRHFGSGNVYHEDANGQPFYDWSTIDPIFDAWRENNCRPIVELAFTPRGLVPADASLPYKAMPSVYGPYESGLWAFPPRDNARWAGLVEATVRHFVERYSADEVSTWFFELWNEPDISYWQGTPEQFFRLYDFTAAAVKAALPTARVGGPTTTHRGAAFFEAFLAHCAHGTNAVTGGTGTVLDFVSFHTKGVHLPRITGPFTVDGVQTPERVSPNLTKMLVDVRTMLAAIAEYPAFRDLPVVIDECDASVPAHWSIYDNANFGYRNTEYYAVFQCVQMKKLLDLDRLGLARVALATTWSWYFEGERYFEGTRSLFTTSGIEKPVLNAYRLLGRLGDRRLTVESSEGWTVDRLAAAPAYAAQGRDGGVAAGAGAAEIDALATIDGSGRVAVLVWHFADDQYRHGDRRVEVLIKGLSVGANATLRHWRIDAAHSNSFSAWVAAGRPQDPSPAQLAAMRSRQGLALVEPPKVVNLSDGELRLTLDLPLPSVSLLELVPPTPHRS